MLFELIVNGKTSLKVLSVLEVGTLLQEES